MFQKWVLTWLVACRWSICSEVPGRWFVDQHNLLHADPVARVPVTRRFDLTNAHWAVLEPLLPKGKKPGRPPKWSRRQRIDGIRWRIRTGTPWRDVPDYGHWRSVYGLNRGWQRDGTWARILSALQARADARDVITWEVSVDSTIAPGAPARCRSP